jgi:hypothetical protein
MGGGEMGRWTLRQRMIAYAMSAVFKDCSLFVRIVLRKAVHEGAIDTALPGSAPTVHRTIGHGNMAVHEKGPAEQVDERDYEGGRVEVLGVREGEDDNGAAEGLPGWEVDGLRSSVKLVDLDLKPLRSMRKWAELDERIWTYWRDTRGSGKGCCGV